MTDTEDFCLPPGICDRDNLFIGSVAWARLVSDPTADAVGGVVVDSYGSEDTRLVVVAVEVRQRVAGLNEVVEHHLGVENLTAIEPPTPVKAEQTARKLFGALCAHSKSHTRIGGHEERYIGWAERLHRASVTGRWEAI